jgi:sigma-B regulation protein RsbU (phosphoserine phosphatase)
MPCEGVFFMGFDPYGQVPVTEIRLEPGDRMLLYTDGVVERFNTDRQPYGVQRLCRQIERPAPDGPKLAIGRILQELEDFAGGRPPDDDQTLLMAFIEPDEFQPTNDDS